MSDLASLLSIAPTTAAGFMGTNQSNLEHMDRLKQRELADLIAQRAAESQNNQQMNPLKMEHQRLLNEGLSAGLPSIAAKAEDDALKVAANKATHATQIDATNATNLGKVDAEREKSDERRRAFFMTASQELRNVPTMQRGAVLRQLMEAQKVDANHPMAQKMLSDLQRDPEGFPDAMMRLSESIGKNAAYANPQYHTTMDSTRMTRDSAEKVAADNRASIERVAEADRASRESIATEKNTAKAAEAADLMKNVLNGKTPPDRAAIAAKLKAEMSKSEEDKLFWQQRASEFETFAYNLRNAQNAGKPDAAAVTGIPPREVKPALGAGQPPPAQPGVSNQIGEQAMKAWGAYEPQKYDYRVGPNGQLQRKAK